MAKYIRCALVLVTSVAGAGCTMTDVDPPPLAGPSTMSLSLAITAEPEVLSMTGSSRTTVTVEARDTNGQAVADMPLRIDILADGQATDFGVVSHREVFTGSNGRATFTYTAPSFVGGPIPTVQLGVTPTGSKTGYDASAHVRRMVTVRLVQPGSVGTDPTARFTFVPGSPAAFTNVRFDGSTSTAALGSVITQYNWDFGDGATAFGVSPTHQYSAVGNYLARLTVRDNQGRTNTSPAQTVTVTAGQSPTATFVFSPTAPVAGQNVFFNGTVSTAGAGHRIVSHSWNWGDGTETSGSTASHTFTTPGTYVVVLTVTDEVGQVGITSVNVTVT